MIMLQKLKATVNVISEAICNGQGFFNQRKHIHVIRRYFETLLDFANNGSWSHKNQLFHLRPNTSV